MKLDDFMSPSATFIGKWKKSQMVGTLVFENFYINLALCRSDEELRRAIYFRY